MTFDISRQYDRLYRYCYYHTHNRILAQDIVQEAFTRYMERYGSLNEKNAVPYLYVITEGALSETDAAKIAETAANNGQWREM